MILKWKSVEDGIMNSDLTFTYFLSEFMVHNLSISLILVIRDLPEITRSAFINRRN